MLNSRRVSGSDINYLNYEQTLVENIEFGYPRLNQFIGFSTDPISFTNGEDVTISIISTTFNGYLDSLIRIGIRTDNFILTLGVGSAVQTGLTTYFYVSGDLSYPVLRENDILGIGTENVKVLNIDTEEELE